MTELYVQQSRNITVDRLKGLAIVLVVIGHAIVIYNPKGYEYNVLFMFCYSFHMPLFVILSAYITGLKGFEKINGRWLMKRLQRLMIPNIVWIIISMIFYGFVHSFSYYLFVDPLFWFLSYLALNDFCIYIVSKTKYKIFTLGLLYIIIIILQSFANSAIVDNLFIYYPFYCIGFYFPRIITYCHNKKKLYYFRTIFAILYPFSMFFYSHDISYTHTINQIKQLIDIVGIEMNSFILHTLSIFLNRYIIPILGICFVWTIISVISKNNKRKISILSYLGKYTMPIYLLHVLILRIILQFFGIHGNYIALLGVFLGILIPIILAKLLSYNRVINTVFFG